MKKVLAILIVMVMVVTLCTACGNESWGFGNYEFKKIHIDTFNHSGCLTVKSWYDGDTGIEVMTEEAGSIFVSEGMYVLLEGDKDCPFCMDDDDEDLPY